MIKETTRKIHFLSHNPDKPVAKRSEPTPTVIVSTKYSAIVFGVNAIRELSLRGQFVKFYFEAQRKIIGWQIQNKLEQHELKIWKLCSPNKTTGTWTVGIKGILDQMKLKEMHSYKGLPIQKYREVSPVSEHKNEVFYFIEVKEEEELDMTLNGVKVTE